MNRFDVFKHPTKGWVVEARSVEAELVVVNFGDSELSEARARDCAADLNAAIDSHVRTHADMVFAIARAEREAAIGQNSEAWAEITGRRYEPLVVRLDSAFRRGTFKVFYRYADGEPVAVSQQITSFNRAPHWRRIDVDSPAARDAIFAAGKLHALRVDGAA